MDDASGVSQRVIRKRQVAVALSVAVLVSLPWLIFIPMGVWRGIAIIERCQATVDDRYGKAEAPAVLHDEVRVRWWPPGWTCPLSNGERVTIAPGL